MRKKYFFTKNPKNHARKAFFKQKNETFFKKVKSPQSLDFSGFAALFETEKITFSKKKQKKLKKSVDIWGGLPYNMSCVGQRSTNK